jgi:hypothetical protein
MQDPQSGFRGPGFTGQMMRPIGFPGTKKAFPIGILIAVIVVVILIVIIVLVVVLMHKKSASTPTDLPTACASGGGTWNATTLVCTPGAGGSGGSPTSGSPTGGTAPVITPSGTVTPPATGNTNTTPSGTTTVTGSSPITVGHTYSFLNTNSGTYLSIDAGTPYVGVNATTIARANGSLWMVVDAGSGNIALQNLALPLYMTAVACPTCTYSKTVNTVSVSAVTPTATKAVWTPVGVDATNIAFLNTTTGSYLSICNGCNGASGNTVDTHAGDISTSTGSVWTPIKFA